MQVIGKESELRRTNRICLEVIAKEFVQCIKRDVSGAGGRINRIRHCSAWCAAHAARCPSLGNAWPSLCWSAYASSPLWTLPPSWRHTTTRQWSAHPTPSGNTFTQLRDKVLYQGNCKALLYFVIYVYMVSDRSGDYFQVLFLDQKQIKVSKMY